jgi:hypothetical protein
VERGEKSERARRGEREREREGEGRERRGREREKGRSDLQLDQVFFAVNDPAIIGRKL